MPCGSLAPKAEKDFRTPKDAVRPLGCGVWSPDLLPSGRVAGIAPPCKCVLPDNITDETVCKGAAIPEEFTEH